MKAKSIDLIWIVVSDLKKAIEYYCDHLGMELKELVEEFGWAELKGPAGGATLGLTQAQGLSPLSQGENAVVTLTVEDLDAARQELMQKGAALQGDICEVPGHVRLQLLKDLDGNLLQLVQVLGSKGHS